jgi:cysteine desulfurase / selenocysteine lyase
MGRRLDDSAIMRLRAETPATARMIHFNNAGAALMPDPVYHAVLAHLALEQTVGGYDAEALAKPALAAFNEGFARLLNCRPDEIAHVENATRAWDMAFYGIGFQAGDVILSAEAEYASNYIALLHMAKRRGVQIEIVPSSAGGEIDLEALERRLRAGGVKLVSLTHVPTQSGLVNPAGEVGRLARAHGALYLLDACQSVGQMPVDVAAIGCHMLSGTGRKFLRGPRGTGFLYVAREVLDQLDPPFLDLHAATLDEAGGYQLQPDARRFENWESNVAGRVGLSAAVGYALELGMDAIWQRTQMLGEALRARLGRIDGIVVRDPGRERCGIVTFTSEAESPEPIKARLQRDNIAVSVSMARYAMLDLGRRGLPAVVRASVHYYNTLDEIERFAMALARR